MKRMLINATHAEELRVAIVDGQKLIDIDIETSGREQRKGNIYKGVVTRIEPSLEACFVNYGEERHGFLPFKEIERSFFKAGVDPRGASIKDAITEGQELLIQVEKEERGNKGAALTTFVSLAGRYLVLMPNNPRGGGVSRRIEGEERQELREAMSELNIPQGMSIIARTAGIGRSVEELQHDMDYLLRLWTAIDEANKVNPAPQLIIEESNLEIRAIRDYFSPDIGEILVDNATVAENARGFMTHVMPHMANRIKHYTDDIPLYSRFQIEHQIETAYSRTVPLPSGGAIVIDHTEALVSVDVNSARSTRGSDIEDTAFRTNCEAAEEVARQLRLRDLGGLVVIDFIDMESSKNQKEVESRLKDALHYDRARVQMGKISRFGLMELSRQRLRPSLSEGSHTTCPRCNGTGVIRDIESSALHILRIVQEEAMKEQTAELRVQVPVEVSSYLLNEKRAEVHHLEHRTKTKIVLIPNRHIETPHYKIDRLRQDDERLDSEQASYEQVEKPSDDVEYAKKEIANRQEPVVKGIVPDTPAPMPIEKQAVVAPVVKKGFFARLKAWFVGESEPVVVVEKPKKPARNSNGRNAHNNRSRSETRGGNRPNERRRNRNDKVERKDEDAPAAQALNETRTERAEGNNRRERNNRNRNDKTERREVVSADVTSETKSEQPRTERSESNNNRRERGNRNRNERKETGDNTELTSVATAAVVADTVVESVAVNTASTPIPTPVVVSAPAINENADPTEQANESEPARERRERRSRGGRDRRERRERREQREAVGTTNPEMSAAASTVSQLMRDDDLTVDHTPITIEVAAPVTSSVYIAPVSELPVDTAETFAALIQDEAVSEAVVATSVVEVIQTPTPVEPAATLPVQGVVDSVSEVVPSAAPVVSFDALLTQAGLELVQTDSTAVTPVSVTPPARNHPPRERKPRAMIADEPLQLIETRN
ncbi:ribonuclease E [Formosimonas limnophila]|uniref:Ribonuclease E n=1 Tax=Formosimonas limnophila TaxID=1384487 RepID=A0A8J3CMJ2_9BURK|nr:Rne/Rng family ribonuclease [Formosimonas limnophila]GHA72352.1 ribonuclease E [Formosimonas limnophila]